MERERGGQLDIWRTGGAESNRLTLKSNPWEVPLETALLNTSVIIGPAQCTPRQAGSRNQYWPIASEMGMNVANEL